MRKSGTKKKIDAPMSEEWCDFDAWCLLCVCVYFSNLHSMNSIFASANFRLFWTGQRMTNAYIYMSNCMSAWNVLVKIGHPMCTNQQWCCIQSIKLLLIKRHAKYIWLHAMMCCTHNLRIAIKIIPKELARIYPNDHSFNLFNKLSKTMQ